MFTIEAGGVVIDTAKDSEADLLRLAYQAELETQVTVRRIATREAFRTISR